ncbi:MAG: V-type ATPase subunit [Eubacterium sp.]|nr:V-type ATPase subunit [Eubacterium sp.]
MSETSYPYAVGRIKVKEAGFIDKNRWNRIWESSEDEALKLLEEIGYGAEARDPQSLDSRVDAELVSARELILEIAPDKALCDLLLLPTDAHNIKAVLKGQQQRVEVDDILLEGGGIPLDVLKKAMEHGDYDQFPPVLAAALKDLDEESDPRKISAGVDFAVYGQIAETLKAHKDALLSRYFSAKADFTNILTVLRAGVLHWESYKVKPLFVPGGAIAEGALLDSLGLSAEQLAKQLAVGEDSVFIRSVLEKYAQDGDLTEAEQKFEDRAYAIVHEARNDSFGMGPIANYLLTRAAEARALRVLFASKRSGMKISLAELGVA